MFRKTQTRLLFPERRQHVRIVTIRNFGWLTIALAVAFGAITIRSEMRGRHMANYGRLLNRQIEAEVPGSKPVEVVEESEPAQAAPPQTMYVEPYELTPPSAEPVTPIVSQALPARARESRVAIVGGPEGVAIVQPTEKRPVLSGGFGRRP